MLSTKNAHHLGGMSFIFFNETSGRVVQMAQQYQPDLRRYIRKTHRSSYKIGKRKQSDLLLSANMPLKYQYVCP